MKARMNKKGFTLIELLAVIVILAIIALIAVPQVIKILNQARQSAAEDSAYGVIKAAESYVATYMMEHQGEWINSPATFTCASDGSACTAATVGSESNVTLDLKGTKPKGGTIILSTNGEATIGESLIINGHTCKHPTGDTNKVECTSGTSA